jgi:hypothetical protein
MLPWASWTAKTALLAAGFAAAGGGGLSGVALAGTGGGTSGDASVLSNNQFLVPISIPASICGNAGALLGVARAACLGGATASLPAHGPPQTGRSGMSSGNVSVGSDNQVSIPVSIPLDVCGNAAAVLGDSTAGCAGGAMTGSTNNRSAGSVIPGRAIQSAAAPVTSALGPGSGRTFDNTPSAGSGAGDANVPTASQLVGLGALRGLADLPSLAGLANMPALNGVMGGGIPMPGTALSAADAPGMSSDSFAALAVGALLAGASALKIAGRRARDRRAGLE